MHTATKWLIGLIALLALTSLLAVPIGRGAGVPLPLPYLWHKWLHILGAMLFLGNIVVTAFWATFAAKSKDENVVRFSAKAIHWADVIFTAPGAILLFGNGLLLSQQWGGLHGTKWIIWALALFAVSGIIWLARLIPLQNRMAMNAENKAALPASFYKDLKQWYIWGSAATLLPLGSLVLMVIKPQ